MNSPRLNRVGPTGELVRTSARGALMGNRGSLRNANGQIVRRWGCRRWITCVLDERSGRRVPLDDPIRYTPLFFHDEAVALAAGHRPCARCRPDAYSRFMTAWRAIERLDPGQRLTAAAVDRRVHAYRTRSLERRGLEARASDLPECCFVIEPDGSSPPLLFKAGVLRPWTPSGYGPAREPDGRQTYTTLTPAPFVEVLRQGYTPLCYPEPAERLA
jgi:hypothetical protein